MPQSSLCDANEPVRVLASRLPSVSASLSSRIFSRHPSVPPHRSPFLLDFRPRRYLPLSFQSIFLACTTWVRHNGGIQLLLWACLHAHDSFKHVGSSACACVCVLTLWVIVWEEKKGEGVQVWLCAYSCFNISINVFKACRNLRSQLLFSFWAFIIFDNCGVLHALPTNHLEIKWNHVHSLEFHELCLLRNSAYTDYRLLVLSLET